MWQYPVVRCYLNIVLEQAVARCSLNRGMEQAVARCFQSFPWSTLCLCPWCQAPFAVDLLAANSQSLIVLPVLLKIQSSSVAANLQAQRS